MSRDSLDFRGIKISPEPYCPRSWERVNRREAQRRQRILRFALELARCAIVGLLFAVVMAWALGWLG